MSLPIIPESNNKIPKAQHAFPQELVDNIIDHLHAEKQSLHACSTVCHSWLPSTRYHIFYSIEITCALLRSQGKFHRLLTCLEDSPHLASYVQNLKVDHTSWCIGSEAAENLLSFICAKLKHVKTLTLQRVYIPALPDHLKNSLCALLALSTLRRLSLAEFNVQTFWDLTALLNTCSRLTFLALFRIRWEDSSRIERRPAGDSMVGSLSKHQISTPGLDLSILSHTHHFSPRELKLGGVSYRSSRSLLNFLGQSVEDFELDDIFEHHRFEGQYIPFLPWPFNTFAS